MNQPPTTKQLRSFAFTTGVLLVAIFSGIPLLFHRAMPVWPCIVGGALFLWGLAAPSTLGPAYRLWMIVGRALGYINSRILLSIVFFLLVTPIGLTMRLFGRDPLLRARSRQATTYRIKSPFRNILHMKEPF